jgi:hypothetical protein
MVRHLSALILGFLLVLSASEASAVEANVGRLPAGPCPAGAGTYVAGRLVWCGVGRQDVATEVVWSKRRDSVAFATRGPRGRVTLRVAVLHGQFKGTLLSWPIMGLRRVRRGPLAVMWLGKERVGLGRNQVRPMLVASYRLRTL